MKIAHTDLPGVLIIEPAAYGDDRGWFLEGWSQRRYAELGVPERFVQDSVSMSRRGTVRGLHLQHPWDQGKLVQVVHGAVYDVVVDVRIGSPTFGRWIGTSLSAEEHRQIYIPPGFAHGFCATSETAVFLYKCTEVYHRDAELGVAWNDPDLAISWPVTAPIVSARDASFPRLREISVERLPKIE